ncbi:MAG: efflux RND transporter permease subunit [Treponema sp.]|jgi:multidrug efflux pump subunit AcrB|nr:efflux RND transporter permease subunit [Treponema sp.]
MKANSWLERKHAAFCILMMAASVSIALLAMRDNRREYDASSYTLTFRHYGIDAEEMERSIAIPLEDTLAPLPGLLHITSTSENGRVRAFLRFDPDFASYGRYEAVRDAVEEVYETLPGSVQRPEILSSSNSRIPVWSAAVFSRGEAGTKSGNLSEMLERFVKPRFEALAGAGEVELSGIANREIRIAVDPQRSAAMGISPLDLASSLAGNDLVLPAGRIEDGNRKTLLVLDGRYRKLEDLKKASFNINGVRINLEDIAEIREGEREPDTYSRLDGERAAGIMVMPASGAKLGKLSREIKKELEAIKDLPLDFQVLLDRGEEETKAFRSLILAALEGALAVSLMTFLMMPGGKVSPAVFLSVPLISVFSLGLLVFFGFSPDRPLLSGIASGLGAAVDAVIILAWELRRAETAAEGLRVLGSLAPPLISSSCTTIAALIPLVLMDIGEECRTLAWGSGTITLIALLASFSILPPFIFRGGNRGEAAVSRPGILNNDSRHSRVQGMETVRQKLSALLRFIKRRSLRTLAFSAGLVLRHPMLCVAAALILSGGGILALGFIPPDPGGNESPGSIYAHIEFEGGFRAEEADRLLGIFSGKLKENSAVKHIQSSARPGSGSLLINFDPEKEKPEDLKKEIRRIGINGAFIYFPETGSGERNWTISVFGDDSSLCRKFAREAAGLSASSGLVRETVLNFKDGGGRIDLYPDRERFREAGAWFYSAADTIRRNVHGPVAYKRLEDSGEVDVRVLGAGIPDKEKVLSIPLTLKDAYPVRVDSLMKVAESREGSAIERQGRRRSASFTIRTGPLDPRRLQKLIMPLFDRMKLPPAYSIVFDQDAIKQAENLSGTMLWFLLALLFCSMVIAASSESLKAPLVILPVIPPSLALPLLILLILGKPLNEAAAASFIALSGIAVNAAVLVEGALASLPPGKRLSSRDIYFILRSKSPLLLATAGTTMAGAFPLFFSAGEPGNLVQILSLVIFWGVLASFICSITLVPALFILFEKRTARASATDRRSALTGFCRSSNDL